MRFKQVGKRFLAAFLSVSMVFGMAPTRMLAAGTDNDTKDKAVASSALSTTNTNVELILDYARQTRVKNTIGSNGFDKPNYHSGGFSWDTEKKSDSWRYFNGVMFDAFLMVDEYSNTTDNKEYVKTVYNGDSSTEGILSTDENGNIKIDGYKKSNMELDSIEPARPLFDLLDDTANDDIYEKAIQNVYHQLTTQTNFSNAGGNFLHKPSWNYWKIGLDGIYMAQPFLMEVANAVSAGKMDATFQTTDASGNTTGDITVTPATVYTEVYDRLVWVADNMYDDTTHLYHHGNAALENNNTGLNSGHFWARGIGWYAAALVDVIELMPADQSTYRTNLIAKLTKLYDGMLEYQDAKTGMWYNVVNRDANLTGNKLETSGTAMMAYSMMKAYNNEWVTEDKYAVAALKAFNGIVANKVTGAKGSDNISVADIYKSSSVCDNDGGYCDSNKYVSDEAKGTAVLIMAATLANGTATKLSSNTSLVNERTEKEELETLLKDAAWTSITNTTTDEVYKRVRNVDTSNNYGYVMANSDETISLAYENDSLSTSPVTASGDVLTATGANNLWFIDKTKLYTEVDGKRKYLNVDSTSAGVVMGDEGSTDWTVNVDSYVQAAKCVKVTTTVGESVYYLSSDGTISTVPTYITLWSRVPATVTDGDKAVLYGKTAYSVATGEEVQYVIEDIKEQVKVYYRGKMNQDIQTLEWNNSNISCPWNTLNTETEGTYTLPVTYNNVRIGTIQVTVGTATEAPIEWKDVESTTNPPKYELVQSFENNREYVITRDKDGVYCLQWENKDGDPVICKGSPSVAEDDSGLYSISATQNNTWYYDGGYLYTLVNDDIYYFGTEDSTSTSLTIVTKDKAKASIWTAEEKSTGSKSVKIYTNKTINEKETTLYLEVTSSGVKSRTTEPSSSIHVFAKKEMGGTTTQAALAGKRTYNIAVGEELETMKTTIGTSTKVYYKEDATKEDYKELFLTDPNVVVDWAALRTDTAGTYTIPVSYKKSDDTTVALGDITVKMHSVTPTQNPVQWVDIKDKVTQNDEYTLVRTMEEDSDGYVIAVRGGQVGEIRTLGWTLPNETQETPTYNNNTVLMVQSSNQTYGDYLKEGDTYLFQGVSDANLWYIEGVKNVTESVENANGESVPQVAVKGYLYAKNGEQKYYLRAENTNGYITMTTDKTKASEWTVVKSVRDYTSTYIRFTDANGKVALKGDSTKFNISSENNAVEIWKRTSGADSKVGQVSLGEKMEYTATTNESETDVLNSIKAGTKIYYRVNAETTTYDEVQWTDPNVTYEWQNGFNTATAGTLGLVVKYAGVELGTIVVKVADTAWVKIDRPIFKQVTTLEKESEYGYLIIGKSKKDNQYSSLQRDIKDDNMTGLTKWIDITPYDKTQDLYTVSYSGSDNLWFYDSEGRLFAKTNLEHPSPSKYYLQAGSKDEALTVLSKDVTDSASTWTVSNLSDNSDSYAIYLQADNDLFVRCKDGSFKMNEKEWYIYAYQQTDLNAGGDATLTGTKEHTVRKGDTTFTEVSVKEAATILFKKSGNSYADFVNWDDPSVEYSWTKTTTDSNGESKETDVPRFTTTEAGNYTMTVSYMGVQIDQIAVTVQEPTVSDHQWSLPTENTITTGIHSEPDFSDIKLTIQYSDGSTDVLTVKDGLTVEGDYNINAAGTYDVTVKYGTETEYSKNITIKVDEDPYYGLETVTGSNLPSYPEEGAVRVKKDAYDDDTFAFRKTGVTEVELDVAGISSKNGVDVVLVVDVSNSMGWTTSWGTDRKELMTTAGMEEKDAKDWWKIPGADAYLKERYGAKDGETEGTTAENREETYLNKIKSAENNTITTTINATASDTGDDKLDAAMDAAAKFAEKLLGSNEDGSYKNNSLSFVTFAGYDAQNFNGSESYIDSVQTVFTGVESEADARKVFEDTKFTSYTITDTVQTKNEVESISTKVQYNLNLANLNGDPDSGQNRGNTNYDYGLSEAQNAVDAVRSQYGNSYDELGRHTIVLFMTDGAATHYNNERADGTGADRIYDYNIQYPGKGGYLYYDYDYKLNKEGTVDISTDNTKENWEKFLLKPNKYAQKLDESVEAFYAVGFDLAHGGFSNFSWAGDKDKLKTVLTNMAGFDYSGKPNVDDVQLVDNYDELNGFFEMIASKIQMPGKEAQVEDMIHPDYTLQIGSVLQTDNEFNLSKIKGFMPSIQVKSYKLYTAADNKPGLIGQRKEGDGNVTVIETVTFKEITDSEGNVTGIEAYSNLVGEGTNILTLKTDANGNIKDKEGRFIPEKIEAKTFTYDYTKDVDNDGQLDEMFYWRLDDTSGENRGNITEEEYALSYYVYLKQALYKEAPAETYDDYDTNQYAKLDYIDIDGNHAIREFPVPDRAWGSAKTEVEFYLVNQSGVPINLDTGEEVTFDTRYKINVPAEFSDDLVKTFLYSNEEIGFTAKELSAYLPSGYKMYNENASYTVQVPETGQGDLNCNHGSETENKYGQYTTQRFDTNTKDYSHTKVAFAVVLVDQVEVSKKLSLDRVVIDYGKPVQVNVLENDTANKEEGYSYQVVGFVAYNSDPSFINMTQGNSGQTTYTGKFGQFSLVAGDPNRVQYTPTKMLSQVEKVFTVVKAEKGARIYYLYQELEVIPATNVYYETDFAEDVFTFTQTNDAEDAYAWQKKTDETNQGGLTVTTQDGTSRSDSIQDDGLVRLEDVTVNGVTSKQIKADQTYGYDESYTNDSVYSNGTSWFVKGKGVKNTKVTFSFTGTGFDLISRTGTEQGSIRVTVFEDQKMTKRVKTVTVLNKSESQLELAQIPVVTIEGLEHGTYYVEIGVSLPVKDQKLEWLNRGDEFYFDAIRVYNPIDVTDVDINNLDVEASTTVTTATDSSGAVTETVTEYTSKQIAALVYHGHKELYPYATEVRNHLITADSFGYDGVNGAIFIDRYYGQAGNVVFVTDYKTIGPNNEVYLAKDQAIAFQINTSNLSGVDVGVKAPMGTAAVLEAVISRSGYPASDSGNVENKVTKNIASATEQFIDLMSGSSSITLDDIMTDGSTYIVIKNSGDGMLSVTDIKLTYTIQNTDKPSFSVDDTVKNYASEFAQ